jgi:hypothetical protein
VIRLSNHVRKFSTLFPGMVPALSGLALFLLAACAPSDINKTVTSGSYDGFVIGSTGEEAYACVRQKVLGGETESFWLLSEVLAGVGERQPAQADSVYAYWRAWKVYIRAGGQVDPIGLEFANDSIVSTSSRAEPNGFHRGMNYDSAFRRLRNMALDTSFDGVTVKLVDKDFAKPYDPGMVDTAFQDVQGDGTILWWLFFPGGYHENYLELAFRDRTLVRITRLRTRYGGL